MKNIIIKRILQTDLDSFATDLVSKFTIFHKFRDFNYFFFSIKFFSEKQ